MATTTTHRMLLTITEPEQLRLLDSIAVLEAFNNRFEQGDVQKTLWNMLRESVGSESGGDWFAEDRMRALELYEYVCELVPYLPNILQCLAKLEKY